MLQLVQRLPVPGLGASPAMELNIGIDPGDRFPVGRQALNSEVDGILFMPKLAMCPQLHILWVTLASHYKRPVTKRHFHRPEVHPGVLHMSLELLIKPVATPIPYGV